MPVEPVEIDKGEYGDWLHIARNQANRPGQEFFEPKELSVTWHGLTLAREPTAFEEAVLDLAGINERFEQELTRLVNELLEARRQTTRKFAGVHDLSAVSMPPTGEIIRQAQLRMVAFGAQAVRSECERQGVQITMQLDAQELSVTAPQVSSLATQRQHVAMQLDAAHQAGLEAARDRLVRAKRKADPDDLLRQAAKREDWGLKTAARGVLNRAFVMGRHAEMQALKIRRTLAPGEIRLADGEDVDDVADLVDYVVQSAILDKGTCGPCEGADGMVFEFGSAEQQEYEPPYYDCDGTDNCRCIQIAVVGNWRDREDVEDALTSDRVLVRTEKQAERIIEKRQGENRYTED